MMDKNTQRILIYVGIAIVVVGLGWYFLYGMGESFDAKDDEMANVAVTELEDLLASGQDIPEVSDEELETMVDDIYMVKTPSDEKEGLTSFHAANTRYWPYYYYSFPYNYKYGGAWPPGLFSRLYYWSPGFYTGTGWSYHMRPGMGHKYWPRHRWVRKSANGSSSYYFLTNAGNYVHDAANYKDTPLRFLS